MWSLLILTTSANFPDVMLPAYKLNRAACIFFISFLVLSLFLFMSMVLAIIYQGRGFEPGPSRTNLHSSQFFLCVVDNTPAVSLRVMLGVVY
jgi:hypothetical protein